MDQPPSIATPASQAPRGLRQVLILVAVVAVIHTPSLFSPFFIDDYVFIEAASDLDWRGIADIFTSPTMDQSASGVWWAPSGTLPFYRPIGQISFALDHALWGLRPLGYHLTNLVLHLVCTVLTWRLAQRLFEAPGAALAVAVVFALHPLHGEAVTWISGRFDLLVCLCMLASIGSYLNWQASPSAGGRWAALAILWFTIGLGCKETALILPAVLAGMELLGGAAHRGRGRRLVLAAALFGAVALVYIAGRYMLFGGLAGKLPPPYGLDTSSPLAALQGIAWSLAQYLLDFVLFVQVEPFFFAHVLKDNALATAAALALCAVILVASVLLAWRARGFRVGAVWLALFTAPALLALPGERNVYLANVGAALIIVAVLQALRARTRSVPGEPGVARGRRLQLACRAVVGLWLVMCVIEQASMWCVASTGEKVFRDLERLLPDPAPDTRIYVVNQCPLNSVGFAQAIKLRYGRQDLSGVALSLSPTLRASSSDTVLRTGPDSIRLVREGGILLASFVEQFHLFAQPVSSLPEACRKSGLELLDPPSSYDRLTALDFRFPHPLDDPRIQTFWWDNQRIRSRVDLLRAARLGALRRCEPLEAAALSAAGRDDDTR